MTAGKIQYSELLKRNGYIFEICPYNLPRKCKFIYTNQWRTGHLSGLLYYFFQTFLPIVLDKKAKNYQSVKILVFSGFLKSSFLLPSTGGAVICDRNISISFLSAVCLFGSSNLMWSTNKAAFFAKKYFSLVFVRNSHSVN